jgi:hypothetical protein
MLPLIFKACNCSLCLLTVSTMMMIAIDRNRVTVGKGYRWLTTQLVSVRSQDYRWLSNMGWQIENRGWKLVHNKIKKTGDSGDSKCCD